MDPIDEGAVQAVATAMAKAHHGPDATDAGGYLQDARSFVAAAVALRDYRPARTELPPEPAIDDLPVKSEQVPQEQAQVPEPIGG